MRAFVAVEIPEDIRSRIKDLLVALHIAAGHVRWSRPEGLHITLKFLGEVPADRLSDVEAGLRSISIQDWEARPIHVRGYGYFPNERAPRVIWLGIEAGPALPRLAAQIDSALLPLGFSKEEQPFSPHLTIGRLRESGMLDGLREQLRRREPLEFGSFQPREFFLYESRTAPGGSVYRKVARFPLDAAD